MGGKNIFQCFEISQRNFADFAYKTFMFPRKTFAFPRSLEKNSKVLRANAKNLGGTQHICERTQKYGGIIFPTISNFFHHVPLGAPYECKVPQGTHYFCKRMQMFCERTQGFLWECNTNIIFPPILYFCKYISVKLLKIKLKCK